MGVSVQAHQHRALLCGRRGAARGPSGEEAAARRGQRAETGHPGACRFPVGAAPHVPSPGAADPDLGPLLSLTYLKTPLAFSRHARVAFLQLATHSQRSAEVRGHGERR